MSQYDKSLEYISNTQTLVGTKQRNLVDTETGEQIIVDQITKRVYGSKNFWKCYLMDFLAILGVFDSKQVDVFIYIVENTNQSNNMFIGTYKKIAKDVNVSEATIAKIMKKLQQNNFIKRVQNGAWLVNPNILMKGNDTKRQVLLSYYQNENPIDSITVARTKQTAFNDDLEQISMFDDTNTSNNVLNDTTSDFSTKDDKLLTEKTTTTGDSTDNEKQQCSNIKTTL